MCTRATCPDMDAIAAMADKVLADLGGVDILINNAGRSIRRSLALSYDRIHDYQRTMQLNYLGAVQLILKFIPGMRERGFGQIINVSSVGVQTRAPRFGAYIASKAALDSLCDALQAEVVNDDVRFTTVHMALVRTPMIGPTKIYDKFPTLTPDQAAGVIADAIVHRPRRVSSPFGQFAAVADAVNPAVMDRVRNRAFSMFDDSAAARGSESDRRDREIRQAKRERSCAPPAESIGRRHESSETEQSEQPSSSPAPPRASAPNWPAGWPAAAIPLLLVARRRERLDELCRRASRKEYSVAVEVMPLDLSDAGAARSWRTGSAANRSPACATAPASAPAGCFHELPVERESEEVTSTRWR